VVLSAGACTPVGSGTSASPSPTPVVSSSQGPTNPPFPSPSPSPSPSQQAPAVRPGSPAFVSVAVATLWRSPQSVRPVDAPALANPVRIRQWLAALSPTDQAGLIGRADSQLLLGDEVGVVAVRGGWAQVVVPDQPTPLDPRGYPGWVPVGQFTAAPPPQTNLVATVTSPTLWLSSQGLPVMEVSFGTRLPVIRVDGSTVRVAAAGQGALDAPAAAVTIGQPGAAALPPTPGALMASLRMFLGLRYLWAGSSAFGYDCSGLVYLVFKTHGIEVPRDAQDQAGVGTPVDRRALQAGDLVFLAKGGVVHHVAIYAGAGMVLDSPDLGLGVQLVSISVAPYSSEYAGARRVLP
jgi:cell wall-associated NlpC family hydrolase